MGAAVSSEEGPVEAAANLSPSAWQAQVVSEYEKLRRQEFGTDGDEVEPGAFAAGMQHGHAREGRDGAHNGAPKGRPPPLKHRPSSQETMDTVAPTSNARGGSVASGPTSHDGDDVEESAYEEEGEGVGEGEEGEVEGEGESEVEADDEEGEEEGEEEGDDDDDEDEHSLGSEEGSPNGHAPPLKRSRAYGSHEAPGYSFLPPPYGGAASSAPPPPYGGPAARGGAYQHAPPHLHPPSPHQPLPHRSSAHQAAHQAPPPPYHRYPPHVHPFHSAADPPHGGPPHGGPHRAGPPRAGPPHEGPPHAGPASHGPPSHGGRLPHSGPPHAGPPRSSGPPRSGPPHAGPPQAGPPLGGPPRSGPPHAGAPHAAQPHGGPPHAAPPPHGGGCGPCHPWQPSGCSSHAAGGVGPGPIHESSPRLGSSHPGGGSGSGSHGSGSPGHSRSDSLNELNLTMEAALCALYDENLMSIPVTPQLGPLGLDPSSVQSSPSIGCMHAVLPPNALSLPPPHALPHAMAPHGPPSRSMPMLPGPAPMHWPPPPGHWAPPPRGGNPCASSAAAAASLRPGSAQPGSELPPAARPKLEDGVPPLHVPAPCAVSSLPHAPGPPGHTIPRSSPPPTTLMDGAYSSTSDRVPRLVWQQWEDDLILKTVAELGPKWRKVASLLAHRSDDAVRNRWHRLSNAASNANSQPNPETGEQGGQSNVYRCSRCGQPKRNHRCTAPDLGKEFERAEPKPQAESRLGWSRHEDEIILSAVNEFGPKWVEICQRLRGRTEHAARNRYHRLVAREGGESSREVAFQGPPPPHPQSHPQSHPPLHPPPHAPPHPWNGSELAVECDLPPRP